jgi:hypothetical protein
MSENHNETADGSKRSLAKKGAVTATAVALGAGAMAGTSAAQNDDTAVVFGNDYSPDVDYEIVSQADTGRRNAVFEATDLDDELSDPDDWDLYVIMIDTGGSDVSLGYLMSDDTDVDVGDSDSMDEDASIRNSELNLIEFDL